MSLGAVCDLLRQVQEEAGRATAAVQQTESLSIAAAGRISEGVNGEVASAQATMAEGLQQIEGTATKAVQQVRRVRQSVASGTDGVRERLGELEATLDDFNSRFGSNAFTEDFFLQLEAVKAGAKDVEDLIRLYGDAEIAGQKVRDFLQGADFRSIEQEIQSLISSLSTGAADLEDVAAFLERNRSKITQPLLDIIQGLADGRSSLDQLAQAVSRLQDLFPGSDLGDLAGAIGQAARRGQI